MHRRLAVVVGVGLAVAITAGSGRTAAARDLIGTRATGMGGALRAAALGSSSVLLNPAGMSLARMYVINALYQWRGSDAASQLSASVVDSATSRKIAAGLFYNFSHASPTYTLGSAKGPIGIEQTTNTHEIGVALSMPLGQYFVIGVSGRYINHGASLNEGAPEGLSLPDLSTFTMDVGGVIRLGRSFNIAVVGYNLIPVDDTFSALFPQSIGLGVSYAMGTLFLAEFDTVLDFTSDKTKSVTTSVHGGLELFLGKRYVIRGGAMHSQYRDATYVTGGLGLVTKRLGVDASLRQMVDGGNETLLAFALKLFLQ
ncbi:MAG: hypothetical protein CSA65_03925 [Proteobacteria bacterium]|nr:MAG: hypothetical protein CSA65_03925 [Pseudomonadota bacterium]